MSKRLSFAIAINLLTENFKQGANTVKNYLRSMQMQVLTFATALGAGGLGLMSMISRMKDVARETNRAVTALKNVSGGTAQFADNLKFINELAKKYGIEINGLTASFVRFTASATNAGMPMEKQQKIFESVSRAISVFNLSSEESKGVMLALSQMMGKGKISSEELRKQMGEKLPIAMSAMAKAAGTSMNGLEKLLQQGKLISADILPKFAEALDQMVPNVDTDNLETSLNRLQNTFTKFVQSSGIQDKYKSIVDAVTKMIEIAADNIKTIVQSVVAVIVGLSANSSFKILKNWDSIANEGVTKAKAMEANFTRATAARVIAQNNLDNARLAHSVAIGKARLQAAEKVAKAEILFARSVVAEDKANLALQKMQATQRTSIWDRSLNTITLGFSKLKLALKGLWRSFAPMIIITALTMIGQKLYELATKTSSAEKAMIKFNEESRNEITELNGVFNAYKRANEGTKEKTKLLDIIKSKYGEYIKSLIDEKGRIIDIEAAQRMANEAIKESIALKIKKESISDVTSKGVKQQASSLGGLRKILAKTEGDEVANMMISKVGEIFADENKSAKESAIEAQKYLEEEGINLNKTSSLFGKSVGNYLQQLMASTQNVRNEKKEIEDSFRGLIKGEAIDIYIPKKVENTSTYADDYKQAKLDWEKAKKELQAIEKDKSKFTSEQYKKAKESEKTAKTNFETFGGVTKIAKTSDNKDLRAAEKKLEAQQWLIQKKRELENAQEKATLDFEQRQIDIEEDSFGKRQKQIDLNHKRELLSIKEFEAEKRKEQLDTAKKLYTVEHNGSSKGFDFEKFDKKKLPEGLRPEDITSRVISRDVQSGKQQEKYTDDLLKSLLEKYQDYNTKRLEINKKFDADLVVLESKAPSDKNDAAIAQLKKNWQEALSSIDIEELRDSLDWQKVFGDLDRISSQSIEKLREKLKTYISESGKNLSPTDLKILTDALDNLDKKFAELKPNKALTDSLNDYKIATEKIKKTQEEVNRLKADELATTEQIKLAQQALLDAQNERIASLSKLNDAKKGYVDKGREILGVAKSVLSTLDILGVKIPEGMSIMVEGWGETLDALDSIDFTKPMTVVSGSIKAVGGIAKSIKGFFGGNVNKEHRQALRLLEQQRKEQERIYKLALLKDNLDSKKSDTIFGTDNWGKAADATKVYQDAIGELDKSLEKLQDVDVVTGSKKKGKLFWKKRKDVWSDLLSVYPQLIDANGKFDKTLAQTILSTRKLSDEGKKSIEQAIENATMVEDAYAKLKDYLSGVFGELGDNMMSAFVDAFKGSKDALSDFVDSASDMLGKLVGDFIYNMRLAPILEKASKEAESVIKNDKLTDEEKQKHLIDIVGQLTDKMPALQEGIFSDLEKYGAIIKEKTGKNPFEDKSSSTQDSSKGYSVSMDQDTGGAILGRITGIHESILEIKSMLSAVNNIDTAKTFTQSMIIGDELKKHTGIFYEMQQMQQNSYRKIVDISDSMTVLGNLKTTLDSINKNTKRL